jgi:hypothetical protein
MFGKKEEKKPSSPDIKVTKMPDDFYAGVNPVVKFQVVEKIITPTQVDKPILPMADKNLLDKQTAVGAGNKLHPINLLANWKFLLIAGGIILLIGSGGTGAYYYWQYKKSAAVAVTPQLPVIVEPEIVLPEVVEPTTTTVAEIPFIVSPTLNNEVKIDFPSILLGESSDTDKDAISDMAEELFGTDPSLPDTDNDKYPDGHEVFYLYNPNGKEPMKIIDADTVKVYINPTFLYKLYYPKNWAVGNIDPLYKDVLFSTITGENIEVRVFDLNSGDSFENWFAVHANSQQLSDYVPFTSVFKEIGYSRKDDLVYFFPKDDKIFGIFYHTTDSNIINYKIVAKLIARSFQFGNITEIQPRITEENPNNLNNLGNSSVTATVPSNANTFNTSTSL